MADLKGVFARARVINRARAVFDVLGGNYRLVVALEFSASNPSARIPSTTASIRSPSVASERDRHGR
jgi:hypothetical protein